MMSPATPDAAHQKPPIRANLADLDRLVALEAACEGPEAWSETLIREGLAGLLPTTSWLVARDGVDIAGYAVLAAVDDVAELQRIGVDPRWRRQGVATGLLLDVHTFARAAGAERLLLEVRETNEPALALYRREGFLEIARRPKYYRDGATALVMEVVA